MTDLIRIEQVDTDGAIREAEHAVDGDTRADFFRKAAIGGGAVLGSSVLLGGLPELASAKPSKKHDVAILNYALTLEYLESDFYKEALKSANLSGAVLTTTNIVSKHENAHVRFLKKQLGSKAIKKPKFDFGDTTSSSAKFLPTASSLEDTGVTAYAGQAAHIKQSAVIRAAASILAIEARHASRFRSLEGRNFAPKAFNHRATMKEVLKKAKPFIKK
jgi:rubrerythrin